MPDLPPAAPGRRVTPSLAVAALISFLAGFAVMGAEIAAGRLVAPFFGTSTTTWALVIGTVLGSLAAGNLLGGRLSARGNPGFRLFLLLAGAALLLALLPLAGPWLMSGSLTAFYRGDLAGLAGRALPVFALLAAPLLLAGAVVPLVLHASGSRAPSLASDLGRISGRISAAGTAGGLLGTFCTGVVLLQAIGTAATLFVCSCLLALAASTSLLALTRAPRALALLLCAALASLGGASWRWSGTSRADGVVFATESAYNHISVVDTGTALELRVNEGFAVQSFSLRDGSLPLAEVWLHYAVAPAWSTRAAPGKVLILGLGGGTSALLYRRLYPEAKITGVELDPEMVRTGRERLGIDLHGVEVVISDGRTFVGRAAARGERFDVVLVDAFQFPYLPFQLATREFFGELARCLAPGGVLMVNVGRYGQDRGVVQAVARTLAQVFPEVHQADAHNRSNTLLLATRHPLDQAVGLARLAMARPGGDAVRLAAARLEPWTRASWPAGTLALTDDQAPVEWLTDRILWRALGSAR